MNEQWDSNVRLDLDLIFVLISLLIVLAKLHFNYILPYMAHHRLGRFADVERWYSITRAGGSVQQGRCVTHGDSSTTHFSFKFEYYPMHPLIDTLTCRMAMWSPKLTWLRRGAVLAYTGELDDGGRPHGYGRWRDGQYGGESLRGLWRHGVPIGPFISADQSTGFSFRCAQIGFATCCKDPSQWNASRGPRDFECGPLHWGLACTETSISGQYQLTAPNRVRHARRDCDS